jgi:hypothetical protein
MRNASDPQLGTWIGDSWQIASDSFVRACANAYRQGQRAFNEGDLETAFAGLAPDVEWRLLPLVPDARMLRGRRAVLDYFTGIKDAGEYHIEAQEFRGAGEGRVFVRLHGHSTGGTTGIVRH